MKCFILKTSTISQDCRNAYVCACAFDRVRARWCRWEISHLLSRLQCELRISFEHYFFWQHFKPPNRSVSQENSFGFSGNLAEILIENRFHESTSFLGILNSLFHLCVNCFRRVCRSSARNARFQSKLKAQMNPMCQHHDVLQFIWTQICIREIQKV